MKNFNILSGIHYNSLEHYIETLLSVESSFRIPHEIEKLFPLLCNPIDHEDTKAQLSRIFRTVKKINILSHSLRNTQRYRGILDEFIHRNLSELNDENHALIIDDATAYCALRVLMYNLHPDTITDKLRKLNQEEKNSILFFQIICSSLAHYILEKKYEPFKHGELN